MKRTSIYQAIREEWREHVETIDEKRLQQQISIAYKGLSQLGQFSENQMTKGQTDSANWSVTLEQNPMPKPSKLE